MLNVFPLEVVLIIDIYTLSTVCMYVCMIRNQIRLRVELKEQMFKLLE